MLAIERLPAAVTVRRRVPVCNSCLDNVGAENIANCAHDETGACSVCHQSDQQYAEVAVVAQDAARVMFDLMNAGHFLFASAILQGFDMLAHCSGYGINFVNDDRSLNTTYPVEAGEAPDKTLAYLSFTISHTMSQYLNADDIETMRRFENLLRRHNKALPVG